MVGLPFLQVGHPSRNIESYTLSLNGNSRSMSSISTAGINSSQHSRSGITKINKIKEEIFRFLSITPHHDSALPIRYNSASQM